MIRLPGPLLPLLLALMLALLPAALAPLPALATTDTVFAARKAAEDLRAAARALKDAREARDRVAALTRAIRAYEDGLAAMRDSLRRVAVRKRAIELELAAERDRLSRLLGVLQGIQRTASPLVLIHPAGPLGTARAGQILAEVTPALNAQAAELAARLNELRLLEALQLTAIDDVRRGLEGVREARLTLSRAIGERGKLPRRFVADPGKLKRLAENSRTLDGFASGLADLPLDDPPEGAAPAPPSDFAARKGRLPLPVLGTVLRRFNEADAAGLRRPGLVLAAPPLSLVTSPVAATISYAGPFLDYGNVIVLEPEAGYLIILAGLGQVYGAAGQIVPAGAPLGLLGGTPAAADDFLPEVGVGVSAGAGTGPEANAGSAPQEGIQAEAVPGAGRETLYVEIRKGRTPLDPADWFALNDR